MPKNHRLRLAIASVLALCSAVACVATMIEPQWFELLFDESPDGGDGSFEMWLAIGLSAAACIAFSLVARREWRALAAAAPH
jgi:hypothetical protein